ncbi:hypothetical protein MHBO_002780 [Bonamia ostreae]|uniref:Uncharacterized protein n=1 Tax=Bonamia ostreae TaxID=126728 RepID=A0ABV2APF4_9EUKA
MRCDINVGFPLTKFLNFSGSKKYSFGTLSSMSFFVIVISKSAIITSLASIFKEDNLEFLLNGNFLPLYFRFFTFIPVFKMFIVTKNFWQKTQKLLLTQRSALISGRTFLLIIYKNRYCHRLRHKLLFPKIAAFPLRNMVKI